MAVVAHEQPQYVASEWDDPTNESSSLEIKFKANSVSVTALFTFFSSLETFRK